MKIETFFDNFELLASAPNGVQKLRELILQLAVQGKLVEQDEKDEPAAVLIEKIKAEKEIFLKAKKIKKIESFTIIEPDEVRFEIPNKWKWVRFGEITICRDGERIPVSKDERETRQKIYDYYGASGIIDKIDNFLFDKPLLLIGEDGANLLNRSTPIAFIAKGKYWVNNHAHVLDSSSFDCLRYLEVFINAINLAPYVTGTAQPKMNQEKMNSIAVSFPPLAEQRRIVAKVDQLISLCDQLEARQKAMREHRALTNGAALEKLMTARAPHEVAESWRRIYDNFDLFYDAPENVGALRQAILQLAVMGKLVEQDERDEPASVLLDKIKIEKERMIKEKKIRKSELLLPILADEIQHDLPENWMWIRLADICELITDGTHQTPNYTNNGRIFLSAQNVKPFRFMPENCRYVSEEDYQEYVKNVKAQFEDILLTRVGAGIGEAAVIDKKMDFAFYVSIALIRPMKMFIDPFYLNIFLNSPIGTEKSKLNTYGKGVSQGNLNLGLINKFIVPVPPLNEQRRIVTRVDHLMSLCDKLEAGLMRSQADSEKLMEAVVGKMLADSSE